MKEKQNGITLIALIVIIVILLILAGIAITQITGDNGLFNYAKRARNNTLEAQELENIILGDYEKILNEYSSSRENEEVKESIIIDNYMCSICDYHGGWSSNKLNVQGYRKLTVGSMTYSRKSGTTYFIIIGIKEDGTNDILLESTEQSTEKTEYNISDYSSIEFNISCTVVNGGTSTGWAEYNFNDIQITE